MANRLMTWDELVELVRKTDVSNASFTNMRNVKRRIRAANKRYARGVEQLSNLMKHMQCR